MCIKKKTRENLDKEIFSAKKLNRHQNCSTTNYANKISNISFPKNSQKITDKVRWWITDNNYIPQTYFSVQNLHHPSPTLRSSSESPAPSFFILAARGRFLDAAWILEVLPVSKHESPSKSNHFNSFFIGWEQRVSPYLVKQGWTIIIQKEVYQSFEMVVDFQGRKRGIIGLHHRIARKTISGSNMTECRHQKFLKPFFGSSNFSLIPKKNRPHLLQVHVRLGHRPTGKPRGLSHWFFASGITMVLEFFSVPFPLNKLGPKTSIKLALEVFSTIL